MLVAALIAPLASGVMVELLAATLVQQETLVTVLGESRSVLRAHTQQLVQAGAQTVQPLI